MDLRRVPEVRSLRSLIESSEGYVCWDKVPLFRGFLMVRDLCFTAFDSLDLMVLLHRFVLSFMGFTPVSREPVAETHRSSLELLPWNTDRKRMARMRWMNGASGKGVTGLPGILDIPR
jgi:hypothetical protein